MTLNIHLLTHLCHDVRQLGPLWTHSCFPFESFNHTIMCFVHGTRWIPSQINWRLQALQVVRQQIGTLTKNYCLFKSIWRSGIVDPQLSFGRITLLGKQVNLKTIEADMQSIIATANYFQVSDIQAISSFPRMLFNNTIYHTQESDEGHKQNNHTIELLTEVHRHYSRFARIQEILLITTRDGRQSAWVVLEALICKTQLTNSLWEVQPHSRYVHINFASQQ